MTQRNTPPPSLAEQAIIPGIPEARHWADEWPQYSREKLDTYTDEDIKEKLPAMYKMPHNYLAISGGGANGAFGAGLLEGWTASGTRPEFSMVTGVSTGALTAPFAFLGSEYDDVLKRLYSTTTSSDVAKKRGIISTVLGDALADTAPLKDLISEYATVDIIEKIACEHQRGRRLYVGTVDLDAGRSVIWNIGAIAVSDSPQKVSLIRTVLLASAAIPVFFPPVVIPVEIDGQPYDEMHVDGGAGSQVFVYPAAVNWRAIKRRLKVQGAPNVYIIRNSFIGSNYQGVKRSVLPIAARAIYSLIRTQGIGDLYQIHALCQRDGNTFNLAYIPDDFVEEATEQFDQIYMTKLYERGYDMAVDSYPWEDRPPGLDV